MSLSIINAIDKAEMLIGEVDSDSVTKVKARMSHDRIAQIHADVYNEVPAEELLQIYLSGEYDVDYGVAVAEHFGYQYDPSLMGEYDILKFPIYSGSIPPNCLLGWRLYGLTSLGFTVAKHNPKKPDRSQDGYNHINIYSSSKTILGMMCSNFYGRKSRYDTPFGGFYTLEGYYHYLRMVDYVVRRLHIDWKEAGTFLLKRVPESEQLKTVDGITAISLGRRLKSELYDNTDYRSGHFTEDSEKSLLRCLIFKLTFNVGALNLPLGIALARFLSHGVELDHYYCYSGTIRRPQFSEYLPNLFLRILKHVDPKSNKIDMNYLISKLNV